MPQASNVNPKGSSNQPQAQRDSWTRASRSPPTLDRELFTSGQGSLFLYNFVSCLFYLPVRSYQTSFISLSLVFIDSSTRSIHLTSSPHSHAHSLFALPTSFHEPDQAAEYIRSELYIAHACVKCEIISDRFISVRSTSRASQSPQARTWPK